MLYKHQKNLSMFTHTWVKSQKNGVIHFLSGRADLAAPAVWAALLYDKFSDLQVTITLA
jgi:hypothetical protein